MSFTALARSLRPEDRIAIILVVAHEPGDSELAHKMIAATVGSSPPMPVVFDEGNRIAAAFGTKLFPETWILDDKGRIRARFDGAREWNSDASRAFLKDAAARHYCKNPCATPT